MNDQTVPLIPQYAQQPATQAPKASIEFHVIGEPKAMGRPRAFLQKLKDGRQFVRAYNPRTAEGFKSAIAEAAKPHVPFLPLEGPLDLSLTFFMPRPKAHFRKNGEVKPNAPEWHVSKPDRDNLDKTILDALTGIGMFKDDSQVCMGLITKKYAPAGTQPGCLVFLRQL